MKELASKIKFLFSIILAIVFRLLQFIIPKKSFWVIMERGTDARDNGYFFYKYLKDNHPEKKVYYIIEKDSADYPKVKDDAVQPYSLKYYWAVLMCEKFISTHSHGIIRNLYKYRRLTGVYKKYYFLQHGVIKDFLPSLCADNTSMKLFVCGALPEYEYVLNNFGHSDEVVKYTGLARYDNLHNCKIKRQILAMPTWRTKYDSEFEKSTYFNMWNEFLNDKSLHSILEANNIELIFYPHYMVQGYLHLFKSQSSRVIMASFDDYDVPTLLKESALLITDYSSVYFDFAYMKKPVIYFQFDKDDFFKFHYQKGYFDYDTMGFGKVCNNSTEVTCEIQKIVKNGLNMDSDYLSRTQSFFPLHDNKNCERIYNEIINS